VHLLFPDGKVFSILRFFSEEKMISGTGWLAVFGLGTWLLLAIPSHSQQGSTSLPRWDLMMIEEAHIWNPFTWFYNGARYDTTGYLATNWNKRKVAIQAILEAHPESQWADDAALCLACIQTAEGNLQGAIRALEEVMERYPEGHTVVEFCAPYKGYILDENWLFLVWEAVQYHTDGEIQRSTPFDQNGEFDPMERAILRYFAHLEEYPRLTVDTAQMALASLLYREDRDKADAELQAMLTRHSDLASLIEADRRAAADPDGHIVAVDIFTHRYRLYRIPCYGLRSLWQSYEARGDMDKALPTGLELVEKCSSNGWYWRENQRVGDLAARMERWEIAAEQYRLALQGLRKLVADRIAMKEMLYEADRLTGKVPTLEMELRSAPWKNLSMQMEQAAEEAEEKGRTATTVMIEGKSAVADQFVLAQNVPNPFNVSTVIDFALPEPASVSLKIFDLLGQEVAVLTIGFRDAGSFRVIWDGRDVEGRPAASGIYVYRLTADERVAVRRMLLVR